MAEENVEGALFKGDGDEVYFVPAEHLQRFRLEDDQAKQTIEALGDRVNKAVTGKLGVRDKLGPVKVDDPTASYVADVGRG